MTREMLESIQVEMGAIIGELQNIVDLITEDWYENGVEEAERDS